ncbi:rab-GTPase-TBC domain-containing protein [Scheffersomyces coipomensis]|uniref:rab-GTPase-TBC domain-containing protein n=1 Tax=Scheffersomyces coipomensis TaxID=1788519 RepID=UPI00315D1903
MSSNKNNNLLFPLDNNEEDPIIRHTQPSSSSASSSSFANHITFNGGDNLHQLKTSQILKLIQLKYNNDPIELIKQLSIDVLKKESELIVERQENFLYQQKLIKLCMEFSNLSTLEINKRINDMDHQLSPPSQLNQDSKIVQSLINEALNDKLVSNNNNSHTTSSTKDKQRVSSPAPIQLKSKTTTIHEHDLLPIDSATSSNSMASPMASIQFAPPPSIPLSSSIGSLDYYKPNTNTLMSSPSSSTHWLSKWFNSSEDLSSSILAKKSLKENSLNDDNSTTIVKVPVELESMSSPIIPELSALDTSVSVNIDKYGFFNDLNNITTTTVTATSTPPPQSSQTPPQTESKGFADSLAILIQNKIPLNQTINQLKQISKNHDLTNLQIENEWDELIRDINRDFYKHQQDREEKYHAYNFKRLNYFTTGNRNNDNQSFNNLEIFGLMGLNLLKFDDTNYVKLINLIYKSGILIKYRNLLWFEFSNGKNLCVNGEYQQLINKSHQIMQKSESSEIDDENVEVDDVNAGILNNINQINLDLHRTLPRNYYFNNLIELKPGPNFYKLKRILYSFIIYKPEIGYYQGMNKLVGNLLLLINQPTITTLILKEEDIFWIFIGIIEEILPKYYNSSLKTYQLFYQSFSNIQLDLKIINHVYLKKYIPTLYKLFSKLNIDVEIIIINWWLSLFIDLNFIDLDLWFKIFDILLINNYYEIVTNGEKTIENENDEVNADADDKDINNNQHEFDIPNNLIKFFSITLSILKVLENQLINLDSYELIYKFLSYSTYDITNHLHTDTEGSTNTTNSSNTSAIIDKFKIKYSDLIKHYQYFNKRITKVDILNYRKSLK